MEIPAGFPGQRALAEADVHEFGELDPLTDEELLDIPGIAEKTLARIREERAPAGEVEVEVTDRGWWLRGRPLKPGARARVSTAAARRAAAANPPHVRIVEG